VSAPLLGKLLAEGILRCPRCGGVPVLGEAAAACGHCGARFRFANGALDLYGRYREGEPAPPPDAPLVEAIADALHFPKDAAVRVAVAEAVADSRAVAEDPNHAAEIRMIAERLGVPVSPAPVAPPAASGAVAEANADVRARLEVTHLEPALGMGMKLLRSFRLVNTGTTAISSSGPRPVNLSYHWFDPEGHAVVWEGLRSPLPVDLAPGHALTVIANLATPEGREGAWQLRLALVVEGERWIDVEGGAMPVRLARAAPPPPPVEWTGLAFDYGTDHGVALDWYAKAYAARGLCGGRLLEVGGGIHPQGGVLAGQGSELLAVDVSFPMSQLGALYFAHVAADWGARMAFAACDAHRLPVRHGSFDGALVFSALHHFARPSLMLAELARAVRPGGLVGVLCEPCVPDPGAAEYLRDLREGVNEQIWTVEEYWEIFRRAGLAPVRARADGGSLKVLLERA